jgi:DNA helicase HerA-like ATPase
MTFVLGRESGPDGGPVGRLGSYRARDGSAGAPLSLDLDRPHAVSVVGKRGYGKSYTLGVLAEALARTRGIAPVVVDPMGAFDGLADRADPGATPVPARVVRTPAVTPASLDPRSWCTLLGLAPESGAGGLVWQAATEAETVPAMCEHIAGADAPQADKRAAANHLSLAASWGVFDADGLSARNLATGGATVLDVSGLDAAPMNAVVRGVAESLYRARVDGDVARLPWLLVDEAHTVFEGVARPALDRLLTRGRAPGVSLVLATQRPSAVPDVGISQSDLLVSHRLTAQADLDALERARPTYMDTPLADRMPTDPGDVVVVDDATETVHAARVRTRDTPHGGDSPRASDRLPEQ